MPRVLLRVAYDGTAYAGWQRQENGPSIQAALEQALAPLAGGAVTVTGAGRTDAGVHADGQAAHVDLPPGIDPDVVVRATNTRLPADIRVRSAALVPDDFHARFSAVSKTYRYAGSVSRLGHPLDADALARHASTRPGGHGRGRRGPDRHTRFHRVPVDRQPRDEHHPDHDRRRSWGPAGG